MYANTDALHGLIHMAEQLLPMAAGWIPELAITLRQEPEHNSIFCCSTSGHTLVPKTAGLLREHLL